MSDSHLEETELIRVAFAESRPVNEAPPSHLAECASCRGIVETVRVQTNELRLLSQAVPDRTAACLDEETIVAVAAGSLDPLSAPSAFAHLGDCSRCSREVASVAGVLDAPEVRAQVDRLEIPEGSKRWRRVLGSIIVVAAAAASLVFMVERSTSKVAKPVFREESVTGAAAPRAIAPLGGAAAVDVYRWSSVPRADRYHITLFARDGSVIWESFTRDTTIALPELVHLVPGDTVLWRVAAHVGWEDRWATSDLAVLTVPRAR